MLKVQNLTSIFDRFNSAAYASFFSLLLSTSSFAADPSGTLMIPFDQPGRPATDLTYQGHPIDTNQATDLARKGTDLSTLDPMVNDAWSGVSLPASNQETLHYPDENVILDFDSIIPTTQFARARVTVAGGDPNLVFQAAFGLKAHSSLVTAALLRRLGYSVNLPKNYRSVTVRFPDEATREKMIDEIVDRNESKDPGRWVLEKLDIDGKPSIHFQDVTLEPLILNAYYFHWEGGEIREKHILGRRTFRSLILPLVLADIPESVNEYGWEIGKSRNNAAFLMHLVAGQFQREITFADAQWIARKIGALSRNEIEEIVGLGNYPKDVEKVIVEKMIARRNHLMNLLSIKQTPISYNPKISQSPGLKDGKITQEFYSGYAERFTNLDPDSPLKTDEIFRFLWMTAKWSAFSQKLNEFTQYLQVRGVQDVAQEHYKKLQEECDKIRASGGTCAKPTEFWGGIIGGFDVNMNRSVVTGNYYGSDAKVQLVDSFGITGNIGAYISKDDIPTFLQSIGMNLSLNFTRNWIHVRSIEDPAGKPIKKADGTDAKSVVVPGFMISLQKTLERTELNPDPQKAPKLDSTFLEDLKTGEMLIVVDSVSGGASVSAKIPLAALIDFTIMGTHPLLNLSVGAQQAIVRRMTILRTDSGFQVYLQNMKTKALSTELGLQWWINIFRSQSIDKSGVAEARVFTMNASEFSSADERKNLALGLRSLLKANNSEILEKNYGKYLIDHNLSAHVNKGSFLRWNWYGVDESHLMKIQPPKVAGVVDNPKAFERTFFSHRILRSNGSNDTAFLQEIMQAAAGKYTHGIELFPSGAGGNPSSSFMGKGQWAIWTAEGEITPNQIGAPVTSAEHHWAGWKMSKDALFGVLDGIEAKTKPLNFEQPIMRRDIFNTMQSLQFYEIVSRLMIYEDGMQNLIKPLVSATADSESAYQFLKNLYGEKKLENWCWWEEQNDQWERFMGISWMTSDWQRDQKYYHTHPDRFDDKKYCVTPWMKEILEAKDRFPSQPDQKLIWYSRLLRTLESKVDLQKLLETVKKDNYYFSVKVSGFRTHDETMNIDPDLFSDSIGTYNGKSGEGPFQKLANQTGVSLYELQGKYLGDGF